MAYMLVKRFKIAHVILSNVSVEFKKANNGYKGLFESNISYVLIREFQLSSHITEICYLYFLIMIEKVSKRGVTTEEIHHI